MKRADDGREDITKLASRHHDEQLQLSLKREIARMLLQGRMAGAEEAGTRCRWMPYMGLDRQLPALFMEVQDTDEALQARVRACVAAGSLSKAAKL